MIRALVIDDSAYNRVTIARMLEASGKVTVVATASDGEDAIKQTIRHKPEIITLDLEMPGIDGFGFLRWLMANRPTPVIVVSSRASDRSVFKALELGATDFVAKPGGRISPRLSEIEADLHAKVRAALEVSLENLQRRARELPPPVPAEPLRPEPTDVELVVIGASTGGPPAIQSLFERLPLLSVPFIVAQHMPPTFTRLFAERIDKLSRYRVKEGEEAETLEPGTVYVAPGGMQTEVTESARVLSLRVRHSTMNDLYAPSVNRLFRSASLACGKGLIAVVLTGMGDDGALAMREVRERGGRTMAEAQSSAIIFGMPGEAIRTGAVEEVVPLDAIPSAIGRLCGVG
jgi:two-component system chemotaxis response regulator CheB